MWALTSRVQLMYYSIVYTKLTDCTSSRWIDCWGAFTSCAYLNTSKAAEHGDQKYIEKALLSCGMWFKAESVDATFVSQGTEPVDGSHWSWKAECHV